MKIPTALPGQYVLIIADFKTGHVLNRDQSVYLSKGDDYYEIYNNKEAVVKCAENIVRSNSNIEAVIYNHNEQFERVIRPTDFPLSSDDY